MQIIFTTSKYLLSKMICKVTEEPVSHCAILHEGVVVHSTFGGVQVTTLTEFRKHSNIHFTHDVPGSARLILQLISRYGDVGYDYPALLFLGIRKLASKLRIHVGKVNLWQSSGLFLCTEFITSAILDKSDSMITPYQLHLKLGSK